LRAYEQSRTTTRKQTAVIKGVPTVHGAIIIINHRDTGVIVSVLIANVRRTMTPIHTGIYIFDNAPPPPPVVVEVENRVRRFRKKCFYRFKAKRSEIRFFSPNLFFSLLFASNFSLPTKAKLKQRIFTSNSF
jgi:hypothetical protein